MKPVYQTKFGKQEGNCFEAVVASILETDICSIPQNKEYYLWYLKCQQWLLINHKILCAYVDTLDIFDVDKLGYYEISGDSPRGDFLHSVVGFKGKIVHDPHPDNTGLKNIKGYIVFFPIDCNFDQLKKKEKGTK